MTLSIRQLWRTGDGLGIVNSALCLVHCITMPVLIALGAGFMQHPTVTWGFVALAFIAVRSAVRVRKNAPVAMLLGIGWALFAAGLALEGLDERLEFMAYLGSAILIVGHILNWMDIKAPDLQPIDTDQLKHPNTLEQ